MRLQDSGIGEDGARAQARAAAAQKPSYEQALFVLLALAVALTVPGLFTERPGFTDAFYHFNAANRLVNGSGLTDMYLWNYIYLPETLPAPSHLYWMPLTSLVAAAGMWLFELPGRYSAAQVPLALLLVVAAYQAYWLGRRIGGGRRHAWVAGLITLMGGYYLRFWGSTDTFAPYAAVGSLALTFMALGAVGGRVVWFVLAGVMTGLAHLTRADGLLLLFVGWVVIAWARLPLRRALARLTLFSAAYVLVMLPWFARNVGVIGAPLPTGGTQAIWFTSYDDIFNYPADAGPHTLVEGGAGLLLAARWQALVQNLGTFVAVEGVVVLGPLMLAALWQRRCDVFLRPFWLYAVGLHLAMTLIFPFPGMRGGLLHSAAALLPWWAALAVAGLDDAVNWAARRRRSWRPALAQRVFSAALVVFVIGFSLYVAVPRRVTSDVPTFFPYLAELLPPDARVMVNDPAQLYYFTGLGGVVIPNEQPDVIPEIARRYGVGYLLLEEVAPNGRTASAVPRSLWSVLSDPPAFLTPIPLEGFRDKRLYAIRY